MPIGEGDVVERKNWCHLDISQIAIIAQRRIVLKAVAEVTENAARAPIPTQRAADDAEA